MNASPVSALEIETGLYNVCLVEGDELYCSMPSAYLLAGRLDHEAFMHACRALFRENDTLRSVFSRTGSQVQRVIGPMPQEPCEFFDLSADTSTQSKVDQAMQFVQEWTRAGISLRDYPLMRLRLLRLSDTCHVLHTCAHHIIFDVWSQWLVMDRIARAYNDQRAGREAAANDAHPSIVDYAELQTTPAVQDARRRNLDYWTRIFSAFEAPKLDLNGAPRRPVVDGRIRTLLAASNPRVTAQIVAFTEAQKFSAFAVHLAAFSLVLHALSRSKEVSITLPLANRRHREYANLIGFLVTKVPYISRLDPDATVRDLLRTIQREIMTARVRSEVEINTLRRRIRAESEVRDPFNLWFNYWSRPQAYSGFDGLVTEPFTVPTPEVQFKNYDLMVQVVEANRYTRFDIRYESRLYSREFIVQFLELYLSHVVELTRNPETRVAHVMERAQHLQASGEHADSFLDDRRIDAIVRDKLAVATRGEPVAPSSGVSFERGAAEVN